jgi:hypothetical protein
MILEWNQAGSGCANGYSPRGFSSHIMLFFFMEIPFL